MTNVPAAAFVLIGISISVVLVAFQMPMSHLLVQIIGVVYPCFKSIKALDSEGIDDDKQWLTYWMVFSIFSFIDSSGGFFLSYIPFYYLIKLLILIWLQNPLTLGAKSIYKMTI